MTMPVELSGGNMNAPSIEGGVIYKGAHKASANVDALLRHARSKGLDWVPESFGVTGGKHALSFVEGDVVHDSPRWLLKKRLLAESARRLRAWHDATADFVPVNGDWLLEAEGPNEVVCHNDFAPYNWVFDRRRRLVGLIDFDTCAPGSRLWDIAYAAYRIVPLMPFGDAAEYIETSPFPVRKTLARTRYFLARYASGDPKLLYAVEDVVDRLSRRLAAIAEWSEAEGLRSGNQELLAHARMYRKHAAWAANVLMGAL
ncbi:MAG TPA: aminoglycoside phosphotransferase family protein [Treponemataceae bacterium]|nr:aminoglycoside phosphotransferase family protein [Treponemataceae bacterium]